LIEKNLERFTPEALLVTVADEFKAASQNKSTHQEPRAALLVGQPGAGKPALAWKFRADYNDDIIFVNEEEYKSAAKDLSHLGLCCV